MKTALAAVGGRRSAVIQEAFLATYQAIAATSQTILGLLKDACPREEFPKAGFELYQALNFQTPIKDGVSLFLYRLG